MDGDDRVDDVNGDATDATTDATTDDADAADDAAPRWPAVRAVVVTVLHHIARLLRRYLLCAAIATVLTLPLTFSWAVTHTHVHDTVGTSPATFSLTTRGHSEVRLGLAGTVFVPLTRHHLGVVVAIDGPGDPGGGNGDLASYASPRMLSLYTGLFHDPQAAIDEYLRLLQREFAHQVLVGWLWWGGLGGLLLLVAREFTQWPTKAELRRLGGRRVAAVVVLALVTTSGSAWAQLTARNDDLGPPRHHYPLAALDGTMASGSSTDSPLILAVLGGALAKSKVLLERQEDQERAFRQAADRALAEQADRIEVPRDGELAVMMQSDMHCNTTMIHLQGEVWRALRTRSDNAAPSLLAIAGDLTTNGTAAEGTCIKDERHIAGDAPVAAIAGNHESDTSTDQMRDYGMNVLTGSTQEIGGVEVLGDGDPNRSELFGATRPRGDETQAGQGERLYAVASEAGDDRPDLVLVHEGYAAAGFLGISDVRTLMSSPQPSQAEGDDVRDLPTSAIFYGHWHRQGIPPHVVWNSDGTWTLVMELDTSGGAIDTPTLGRFSTPWSKPLQEASFPVIFLDRETRLVNGYQLYSFNPDGSVVVEPRVDIGPLG